MTRRTWGQETNDDRLVMIEDKLDVIIGHLHGDLQRFEKLDPEWWKRRKELIDLDDADLPSGAWAIEAVKRIGRLYNIERHYEKAKEEGKFDQ